MSRAAKSDIVGVGANTMLSCRSAQTPMVNEYSAKAHQGQQRRNGDPYISHPVAVAEILAYVYRANGATARPVDFPFATEDAAP